MNETEQHVPEAATEPYEIEIDEEPPLGWVFWLIVAGVLTSIITIGYLVYYFFGVVSYSSCPCM